MFKSTQITDFFATQRFREEDPIDIVTCNLQKSLFDGIDENSMTVGNCASTYDGYHSIAQQDPLFFKVPAQHIRVFDTVSSLCSSGDNSLMRNSLL